MAEKKKRNNEIEWIGGILPMPGRITGEGESYQPDVLLWMNAEGAVLAFEMGKPGELLAKASESLKQAMDRPLIGRAHAPTRIRVASPQLADALRPYHAGIDFVCAPTPEIDAVFASMRDKMAQDFPPEPSYLSPDVGPEAMSRLFRAAAGLFRARPWKVAPFDTSLISVSIKKLGVDCAALSVIGQLGKNLGLLLFSGIDDFEMFLDAASALERGEKPTMPPYFAFNFERGADLGPELRKEVAEHHWELASAEAYPWLVAMDDEGTNQAPTLKEVAIAEAVALALPKLLKEKKALLSAWKGGDPVQRSVSVKTHAGDVEVVFGVPFEEPTVEYQLPHDVLTPLFELGQAGGEIDADARKLLEDELVRQFEGSPEAEDLPNIEACRLLMDLAADHLHVTIAMLGPQQLQGILFDTLPRQVTIDASEASWIIEVNRAFFAFLKREFGLEQADGCLAVLGADAEKKLEAALSDPNKFGMAKALMMKGKEAGFDMDSREGIEAWMQHVQSSGLTLGTPQPSPRAPMRPAVRPAPRTTRNQRKAARRGRR